jgi:hypothetical protein
VTDIVERLRDAANDKDNYPRMDSERWLPVGLAREAADEIETLRAELQAAQAALVRQAGIMHRFGDKTDAAP